MGHDVQRLAAHVAQCSDELLHETRHRTARYARASLVAFEEAAPGRHRRQSPMQRLVRALASVRTVTEADRSHFRRDDVLSQHAGVLALVRKGSEAVLWRPLDAPCATREWKER